MKSPVLQLKRFRGLHFVFKKPESPPPPPFCLKMKLSSKIPFKIVFFSKFEAWRDSEASLKYTLSKFREIKQIFLEVVCVLVQSFSRNIKVFPEVVCAFPLLGEE